MKHVSANSFAPVHKAMQVTTESLAELRQVRVLCSTPDADRAGDIVVQDGIDFSNFLKSPTVFFNHDQSQPLARCIEIAKVNGALQALVQFPPAGDDPLADVLYGRVKNGVVNSVSIGFLPREEEPINPKNPRSGVRYLSCELLEFSFVGVPANAGAQILQRSAMKISSKLAQKTKIKGLYENGALAGIMIDFPLIQILAEGNVEVDGETKSAPEKLTTVMKEFGAALIAMTEDEVAELLGTEDEMKTKSASKLKDAAAAGVSKRAAEPVEKSGRKLSAATMKSMDEACMSIMTGHDTIKALCGVMSKDDSEGEAETMSADLPDEILKAADAARAQRVRRVKVLALSNA